MKKSLRKSLTFSAAALVLSLSAMAPAVHNVVAEENEDGVLDFPYEVQNEGEPIEGGTLRVALVGNPFEGLLNSMLYSSSPDGTIISYFNPGLFGYDENFQIDDSGFATVELDPDNNTATIRVPEGHTWHDGEPIDIDDVIFPYYVIGHPDYTGIRYGSDYMNIEGMVEYKKGEAEEISGLERVDDYTLVVHYIEVSNSMLQAGGGISSYIEPEHILGEIPVAELEDSPFVRQNPVGFGAFKVDTVTPGEAVTFSAFDDYYKGRANIDNIVLELVAATNIVQELKAGNYDISELPADQYETFADATNFTTIGQIQNVYTYIGFKHGHWDAELGENVVDPDLIVTNRDLRVAMAHAIDNNAVGERFYHGLRQAANSFITPNFTDFWNPDVEYYEYDPELAKQVLEEAGFVDVDGDGFVETPEGEPFQLNFASMSGGEVAEPLAQYYVQSWQDVGINVVLLDGQLLEMNTFYDRVEADDPDIHVYQGAWTTGGDPNPAGLYSRQAPFNYLRFVSEENDRLIEAISSKESFDEDFRQQAFYEWQEYFMEELPAIPTLYRYNLTAVNNRVSNWNIKIGNNLEWNEIYLLSDNPIAE